MQNTVSYCSFPNEYYKLPWENTSGFPTFLGMSCSLMVRRIKGLREHLLYPFTVCMEEHGNTSPASLRANYFSVKGSPFHHTNISLPQLLKSKCNTYPPPRRSSSSALGHCSYCSLSMLCFLPLFVSNNPWHNQCSCTLPSPKPSCQYPLAPLLEMRALLSQSSHENQVNDLPPLFLENQKDSHNFSSPQFSRVVNVHSSC